MRNRNLDQAHSTNILSLSCLFFREIKHVEISICTQMQKLQKKQTNKKKV